MGWEEVISQVTAASGITAAFSVEKEQFFFFLLASFLIGFLCLTYYYVVYRRNDYWINLPWLEKIGVSFVVGLPTFVLTMFIYIGIVVLSLSDLLMIEQLKFIAPFGFFYLTVKIWQKRNKEASNDLQFIRFYLKWVIISLLILDFLIILLILLIAKAFLIFLILLAALTLSWAYFRTYKKK